MGKYNFPPSLVFIYLSSIFLLFIDLNIIPLSFPIITNLSSLATNRLEE